MISFHLNLPQSSFFLITVDPIHRRTSTALSHSLPDWLTANSRLKTLLTQRCLSRLFFPFKDLRDTPSPSTDERKPLKIFTQNRKTWSNSYTRTHTHMFIYSSLFSQSNPFSCFGEILFYFGNEIYHLFPLKKTPIINDL